MISARGVSQHTAIISSASSKPSNPRRPSVVLVSNEVGSGVVPAYKSGRLYRDLLGELNQQVARVATNVVLLVAGIPLIVLKERR